MNRYKTLENIANGIHAANKIKALRKAANTDSRTSVRSGNTSIISEALRSIAEYSPGGFRNSLGEVNQKCCQYCDTYRNLKQHLSTEKAGGINKDRFVQSLSILEPVLDNRKRNIISKIMKIYDLFN